MYRKLIIATLSIILCACSNATPIDYTRDSTPHLVTPVFTPTPEPEPTPLPKRSGLEPKELWSCAEASQLKCSLPSNLVPPEILNSSDQWPLPNKDYQASREHLGSSISTETINRLEVAWTFPIPGAAMFGSAATNPLIIDSKVYFQDLGSNIFILDLNTGAPLLEAIYSRPNGGPNGVSVGQGHIFASSSAHGILSLNAESGEELWNYNLQRTENEFIDMQPILFGGTLYVSTKTNYGGNATGVIYALDPITGGVRWKFNTVDSDDIWGNPELNSGGGVWYPPSIDVDKGVTYWGVGNPAPWPGTEEFPNGSSRPGPNLYTNSVLALAHNDGNLNWYNQIIPHDLLDYDFHLTPIVTSIILDGDPIDVLIGGGKSGEVIALSAESGEQIWSTKVGIHQNDEVLELPDPPTGITVFPGHFGGVETPMAYSEGMVYAPVVNLGSEATSQWSRTFDFQEGTGELVAIEANSGDIVWAYEFDSMVFGAATVVNDLVFTSTYDGVIYAFDKYSGTLEWSYESPAGINAWPAVSEDKIIFPAGVQTGDQEPILIAFRLDK